MFISRPRSRRAFLTQAAALVAATTGAAASGRQSSAPRAVRRLDRLDLLRYHDADGRVGAVTTPAQWQQRRAEILEGMQAVMGPLPDTAGTGSRRRTPPAFEVLGEVDAGSYVRRTIAYAVDDGPRTPAYLLVPKRLLAGGERARAVLCLHPTDNEIGAGVAVGLGGRPNRAYAAELADRGFVTLAPAYPLLADYQPDVLALGYASGTMKAIWDNMRGLDLLESLPFVKAGGFGVIGHSLGGHNAVYTSVFDERLAVIVSSCGLDLYVDYYDARPDVWQPEKGWCQVRYMPRLLDYAGRLDDIPFDFAELVGALAPRVCFISAPRRDSNFKWESVARIARAARPVYALHGAADRLIVEHPDADHDFPPPMRELAYRLFARHLV
jgi:hypothetical protein